ncbi:glycosyltransferase family 39 protein [bacterium]|nr:glycosyltransferase family 39 protein [bacterium]
MKWENRRPFSSPGRVLSQEPVQLVLVFTGGLLLRLFMITKQYAAAFDEVHYLQLAATGLTQGLSGILHVFWTPLYPLLISLLARVVPNIETAARMISIICGLSLGALLYLFARRHYSRSTALLTLMLSLWLPSLAFMQTSALTEPLYMLLAIGGILLGWSVLTRLHWLWSGAVGFLFALAYITRPEGAGLILVFAAAAGGFRLSRIRRKNGNRFLLIMLFSVLVFAMTSLPYLLFLRGATGRWTPSGKVVIQQGELYGENRSRDEIDVFRDLSPDNTSTPLDHLFHEGEYTHIDSADGNPAVAVTVPALLKKYVTNLYRVLKTAVPSTLSSVLFLLTVLGLFGEAWKSERICRELYLFLYIGFFWFILVPAFHITERYLLSLLPICFVWAGEGLVYLHSWVKGTITEAGGDGALRLSSERWSMLTVTAVVLLGLWLPEFGKYASKAKYSTDRWAPPVEQKLAGIWLREQCSGVPAMMSRYHTVNYYAGNYDISMAVDIPLNSLDRIHAYARHRGTEFLVLNERYIMDNPNMAQLFLGKGVPDFLQLVYDETAAPNLRTVIYRFTDIDVSGYQQQGERP